jgi:sugar phosphate permease
MVYFLSQWFPRKRLAQALALLVIAGPIGSMFVGPLSGWIMSSFGGLAGFAGWQWLFVIQGVPAALLGIIFFFCVPSSPKDAAWLTGDEKAAIAASLGPVGVREKALKQFKKAVTNKRVWLLGFILAANYIGIYAVVFWIPTILKNTGVTDVMTIGYLSSIPFAVAVVATIALGIYCDRSQAHRRALVTGMILAALGLVASVVTGSQLAPTLIGISLASALFTATGPIIWAVSNFQLKGMAAAARHRADQHRWIHGVVPRPLRHGARSGLDRQCHRSPPIHRRRRGGWRAGRPRHPPHPKNPGTNRCSA